MIDNEWHDINGFDDLPTRTGHYLIKAYNGGYYISKYFADKRRWSIYSMNAVKAWREIPMHPEDEGKHYD